MTVSDQNSSVLDDRRHTPDDIDVKAVHTERHGAEVVPATLGDAERAPEKGTTLRPAAVHGQSTQPPSTVRYEMSNDATRDAGIDRVDQATIESDEKAAAQQKDPGAMPTQAEQRAADRVAQEAPDVEDEYREMTRKGAEVEGEGKIV